VERFLVRPKSSIRREKTGRWRSRGEGGEPLKKSKCRGGKSKKYRGERERGNGIRSLQKQSVGSSFVNRTTDRRKKRRRFEEKKSVSQGKEDGQGEGESK